MTTTAPASVPPVPADSWSTNGRQIVDASGAVVGKASTMQGAINRLERIRRDQRAALADTPARIAAPLPPVPPALRRLTAVPSLPTQVSVDGVVIAETRRVELAPAPLRSTLPPTDADDVARGPIAVPTIRPATDYAPDPVGVLDGEPDPVALDGRRCDTCRGFGLVRGKGERKGQHYRSNAGAQAALANGNAEDCPTCEGLGLVLDDVAAEVSA